jgi:hypothetical protein
MPTPREKAIMESESTIETEIHLWLQFRRIATSDGLQEFGRGLEKTRLTICFDRYSADIAAIALKVYKAEFSSNNEFHRIASNSEMGCNNSCTCK